MEPKSSFPNSQVPATGPYLSHMNPVSTLPPAFSKLIFNAILLSMYKSFASGFLPITLYGFSSYDCIILPFDLFWIGGM